PWDATARRRAGRSARSYPSTATVTGRSASRRSAMTVAQGGGPPAPSVSTTAPHRVVAFTLGLIAVAYLDRVCIATAAPTMRAELGLSDAQMGLVFSAFTFAYALFEVPSGWMADRFGARITLTR